MSILDSVPFIRRTRRNHAIEHAAVHILSARLPGSPMAGRSDSRGFYLFGRVATDAVEDAVHEAMDRLDDEPNLAIHPHCGTNLVVGGVIAGITAMVAASGPGSRTDDGRGGALKLLPRFMLAGTVATVASQPLGPVAQKHLTTLPRARDARLVSVNRSERGRLVVHRIEIEDAPPASGRSDGDRG